MFGTHDLTRNSEWVPSQAALRDNVLYTLVAKHLSALDIHLAHNTVHERAIPKLEGEIKKIRIHSTRTWSADGTGGAP